MNVSVAGTGYVGLVTGAGLAEKGHNVVCVDVVKEKIDAINSGKSPIYEKGLEDILKKNAGKTLTATADMKGAVTGSDMTFICVGTPSNIDGSLDLSHVNKVAEDIGSILPVKDGYHVVVVKSTVLPGTTEKKIIPLLEKASGKKAGRDFGVASNPEFLRESVAVEDFMKPDRIVIGALDAKSGDAVQELYKNFDAPIVRTDIKTAEMIKYASNSFLAAKISYINEIGNISKKLGINVYDVARGMSLDHRIGPYFLSAGLGWGGSCFPKDLKAIIYESKELGYEPALLEAVRSVNDNQPRMLLELARKKVKNLKGKKAAVLGLAFKGGTDDTRDSQAFPLIDLLLKEGAVVTAYDPQAEANAKKVLGDKIKYSASAKDALKDGEIAFIVTEWKEFENLDFSGMKDKIVIDGRNILKKRDGLDYEGLCW